jgi:hypothetical protein
MNRRLLLFFFYLSSPSIFSYSFIPAVAAAAVTASAAVTISRQSIPTDRHHPDHYCHAF